MISLLIYLIESGICLMLLVTAYIILLRRETCFVFNRFYLLLIAVLCFVIPALTFNYNASNNDSAYIPIEKIAVLKSEYTQKPFFFNRGVQAAENEQSEKAINLTKNGISPGVVPGEPLSLKLSGFIKIVVRVYWAGFAFFLIRLLYMFLWIFKQTKSKKIIKYKNIKVVYLDKQTSSFSFLSFVFLNPKKLGDYDHKQIIEHERIHIQQGHTYDLLIVSLIALFQWFNPFVWILQRSIKTNHEYLADHNMLEQGFSVFDYQRLLLSQLISKQSVSIVNSFNLISVKNRISMMKKLNQKRMVVFKAMLLMPFIFAAFILFSNLTMNEYAAVSVTTTGILDSHVGADYPIEIELPEASNYKKITHDKLSFPIHLNEESVYINEKKGEWSDLSLLIQQEKNKYGAEQLHKIIVRLVADKNVSMSRIIDIKQELRNANLLKIAYVVNPSDKNATVNKNWSYARLLKLPPNGGLEILEIVP